MLSVCNICTDVCGGDRDVSALPCGHVFHWKCVEEWTKIQQTCPQCRKLFEPQYVIRKLYIDKMEENSLNSENIKEKIGILEDILQLEATEKAALIKENDELKAELQVRGIQIMQLHDCLKDNLDVICPLPNQLPESEQANDPIAQPKTTCMNDEPPLPGSNRSQAGLDSSLTEVKFDEAERETNSLKTELSASKKEYCKLEEHLKTKMVEFNSRLQLMEQKIKLERVDNALGNLRFSLTVSQLERRVMVTSEDNEQLRQALRETERLKDEEIKQLMEKKQLLENRLSFSEERRSLLEDGLNASLYEVKGLRDQFNFFQKHLASVMKAYNDEDVESTLVDIAASNDEPLAAESGHIIQESSEISAGNGEPMAAEGGCVIREGSESNISKENDSCAQESDDCNLTQCELIENAVEAPGVL